MTVLEAALLRFEWLQLCYSVSSESRYGSGSQLVFTISLVKGLLYMVPADERLIHAHEVNVCNVVHEEEELGLSTRRLCDELMHLLQRWHVRHRQRNGT